MIISIIPAKKDSNRFPNKNMQPILGKPMLYYSIKLAKESNLIKEIYVSTDSDEIAQYATDEGLKVIKRGIELGGETPIVDVYYHALKSINNPKVTVVVGIQADHPDRKINLDDAISYFQRKNYDELITVDGKGLVNGSLKIMRADVLLNKQIKKVCTMMDDCTNIHTSDDLKKAESNLLATKERI